MTSVIQFRRPRLAHPLAQAKLLQSQAFIEAAERDRDDVELMTRQAAQEVRERLERSPDNDRGK